MFSRLSLKKKISLVVIIAVACGAIAIVIVFNNSEQRKESTGNEPTAEELAASDAILNELKSRTDKTYYQVVQDEGTDEQKQEVNNQYLTGLVSDEKYDEALKFASEIDLSTYTDEGKFTVYVTLLRVYRIKSDYQSYKDTVSKIVEVSLIQQDEALLKYWKEEIELLKSGNIPDERVPESVMGEPEE